MTVSYSAEVPNGSSFGIFWKILWKWRGSVYKLIWRELLAYLCLYYTINLLYRYAFTKEQQITFQNVRQYFGEQKDSIPMSFVLGFYVNLVVKRWWEQFRLLPWPDTLALLVSTAIPGNHETGRLMRRNIVRYGILAYVITLRTVSLRVKKRFPEWQHLVDAGLMHESEQKIFEIMDEKTAMSKYWMPLVWATNIINRARKEGYISCDHLVQTILNELSDVRWRLGSLIGYDTVCVPLVYTQVVTHVIYVYFIAALVGRQMIEIKDEHTGHVTMPDLYFPLFTALQFCFYVGWLKVAAVLINPFGEDDDDIELNWLIDRHVKAAYMIVDEMHEEHPELLKDQYWEEVVPKDLPYTVAAEQYRRKEPKGSAEHYKVKEADSVYANLIPSKKQSHMSTHSHADDHYADYESVDTPIMNRRKSWFVRQISKMGSFRSSSSALFAKNNNCNNSVYSSPEMGAVPPTYPESHPNRKLSLYEIFVGRKSARAKLKHLHKQQSKSSLNAGNAGQSSKERPRVPSPEVTNEVFEKNFRTNNNAKKLSTVSNGRNLTEADVALMTKKLARQQTIYQQSSSNSLNEPVIGTLILSPINEIDLNNSANSTFNYPSENSRGIVIPAPNGEAKINVEDLGKSLPSDILPLKITTIPSTVVSDSGDTNSRRGRFRVTHSFDESSLPEPESVGAIFKTSNIGNGSSRSSSTAASKSTKSSPKLNNHNDDKGGEVYV